MMEWVGNLPLLPAVAFLYVVIWCRAGATYLLGRGARRAADRGRIAAFLNSPSVRRATELINRWGAPVVALSFLTIGFQTAANAAAGLTGMPAKRYLPALAIGGLAWAVIYATVGLVAFMAWFELFLLSPWAAVAALGILVLLVWVLLRHRRRTGGVMAPAPGTAESAEDAGSALGASQHGATEHGASAHARSTEREDHPVEG
ncbi:MAG: DedA family protein [Brachybacterium sp.]|uniref:DedA family protein n=1 Tax=unclassified Brachybacterium TaxID=2623841 RepID=UPI003F8E23C4